MEWQLVAALTVCAGSLAGYLAFDRFTLRRRRDEVLARAARLSLMSYQRPESPQTARFRSVQSSKR